MDVFNECSLVQLKKQIGYKKKKNRLLSKGMSNIYLKVTIEKKWRTQNFDFLGSRSLSPGHFVSNFQTFAAT